MEQNRPVVAVQISVQAFNAAVATLQKLPYEQVADVMNLVRAYQPVYAPEEKPVDAAPASAVDSSVPADGAQANPTTAQEYPA